MAEQEREQDREPGSDAATERLDDRSDDARPTRPGEAPPREEDEEAQRERPEGRAPAATPLTQQLGRAFLVILAILFTVFALSNLQPVTFSWVFGQTEVVEQAGEHVSGGVRLIVLLVAAFITGALIGAGLMWRRDRRRYLERDRR